MARVLIIDDDAPTRDVLRQLLNREGYETVEACDGREGVQCSQAASMDVIILDMLLPEQNGLEVIRELRGGTRRCRSSPSPGTGIPDHWMFFVLLRHSVSNARSKSPSICRSCSKQYVTSRRARTRRLTPRLIGNGQAGWGTEKAEQALCRA